MESLVQHCRARLPIVLMIVCLVGLSGCLKPRITLFPDPGAEPLKESVLEGEGRGKVAVIGIRGFISDTPKGTPFRSSLNMLQDVTAQLGMAEKDDEVKAIILKIDSPGGSITASDALYHEIMEHRNRTGHKIVAIMMDVAASGGYYVALSADEIMAHSTTITGSIGVIFVRPKVEGLMGKLGVNVEVNKSGRNKDMGSPFRQTSQEEERILQGLIDQMGQRFLNLVASRRRIDASTLVGVADARIYLADEALQLGLIDRIGYLRDAVFRAKKLAGLAKEAKVVAYRRADYPNDNIYNPASSWAGEGGAGLGGVNVPEHLLPPPSGFYYLWLPGGTGQ